MKTIHVHDLDILNRILERGLCHGSGDGKTTFCAEQAVAAVCGIPITDKPDECVTPAVSAFGRRLNDARWESERVRADGMRDFLIAQIGSKDVVDGREFADRLIVQTVRRVLPIWLRHGKIDEALVVACESATDLESARAASVAARDAAWKTSAYAAAAAAYAAAAAAADAIRKATLPLSASIAVEILRDLKSPGCELLAPPSSNTEAT